MRRLPVCLALAVACLGLVAALGQTNQPYRVKDINPNGTSFPISLEAFDGRLFLNADDGTNGQELWVSDGTEEGTVLVKDMTPGPGCGGGPGQPGSLLRHPAPVADYETSMLRDGQPSGLMLVLDPGGS